MIEILDTDGMSFEELKDVIRQAYEDGYDTPDIVRAVKEVLEEREVEHEDSDKHFSSSVVDLRDLGDEKVKKMEVSHDS